MTDNNNNSDNNYGASSIQVLEGIEAIQKRPGMYIGSTGARGLHHLVYEILDNSIDEAMAGYCETIKVVLRDKGIVKIIDNGRGIPVESHPVLKQSALEIILTKLHSGGKFDSGAYKVSGGLHGVGLAVVNALSEYFEVVSKRNGKIYYQKYMRGEKVTEVMERGPTDETGTIITFLPDKDIFETILFNYETLVGRIRELAFLNKGVRISISDQRPRTGDTQKDEHEEEFHYEGGIAAMVEYINESKTILTDDIYYMEKEKDKIQVEIALAYNTGFATDSIYTFANNINTTEGGMHLSGFRTGLTRAIINYSKTKGILKDKDEPIKGEDTREGLTAVISVKVPDPQFEGQTKTRLGTPRVKSVVSTLFYEDFMEYFEHHPNSAKEICNKIKQAAMDRLKLKTARDALRNKRKSGSLPDKLADCISKKPEEKELFVVEGDSAGGSAKKGRDRKTQAILPLRGKILNVQRSNMFSILKNKEIRAIISALGTGIEEDFDVESLRYHKVIIMCDADVDGFHIETLLLTLFFRLMRGIIDNGFLYIAQPPLFKLKAGKKFTYLYTASEDDLPVEIEKFKDKIEVKTGKRPTNINVQRYKGLGEMNAGELRETTMDPNKRKLIKVTITDAIEAELAFNTLMGDDVVARRTYIEEHADEYVIS
ncbi:MAG: DNA gyrase subunit B [Candidatus Hodarchaeales archaeon]|jgi:DNA gyrase subunit B